MTNQEQIEQAEKAIAEWQQKLSDLNKQAEPKEGEWRVVIGADKSKSIIRVSHASDEKVYYTECYRDKNSMCRSGKYIDWCFIQYVEGIATNEQITYFMGLHADRLGMKEGVKVDRTHLFEYGDICILYGNAYYNKEYDWFLVGDHSVRNSKGNWATVVPEKPKNGKLKAKITELKERIQKAKDILDGK